MVFPTIDFVLCYAFDFITVHMIPFLCLIYVFLNVNTIVATWSIRDPSPRASELNCASRLQFLGCR